MGRSGSFGFVLAGVLLAGSLCAPASLASHSPTVGYYIMGVHTCNSLPVCFETGQCYPGSGDGNGAYTGLFGACGLSIPSLPSFRITVTDYAGEPVMFSYANVQPEGGSCAIGNGFGTKVVTFLQSCHPGHMVVFPWLGAFLGKVQLDAVP